ncbi:MAG: trypsin-like peptidase domain-containing protein [Ruminococcus sp.]|jgi:serine protease Do|nr:trypsin-like peptidase domain-containing protein [Ruminococcus sp.]
MDEIKLERFEEIPENLKKKRSNFGKYIAAAVAIIVVGGASGAGGAFAVNSILGDADTVSVIAKDSEAETAVKPETDSKDSIVLMQSDSIAYDSVPAMLATVKPSVAFVTAKLEGQKVGGGTGIVMSADGYIVTNAHVIQTQQPVYDGGTGNSQNPFSMFGFGFGGSYRVEVVDANDITVSLTNEKGETKDYAAKIIGVDTTTDLAVLKIDGKGLTPAKVGDSSKLEIGESCYTLGYPLGVGLSASDGIISGLDRDIGIEMQNGENQTIALIQTTAEINPGNSGGPLIDASGNVVGITSAKLVSTTVEGFGFAIPISTAMPIISELMTVGAYNSDGSTPVIGISGSNLNATTARYYGLPVTEGILIETVEKGGGADKAGLAPGDIIIKADGKDVKTMTDLTEIKNTHKPGETIKLTIAREEGNEEVTVTL